jgi:hypothetical protein
MTQEANPQSVLGDLIATTRSPIRVFAPKWFVRWTLLDGGDRRGWQKQQLEIGRTVGSRRIQLYLTKNSDQWVRLPIT